ncbi:MAG: TetR family transcriptional regulator [Myxococcota bacterium]
MSRRTADDAARTREAVVDAALAAFAERGFAATRLEEIAVRAGATRGALYHHFDDKGALWTAVLRERWPMVVDPLLAERLGPGEPRPRIAAFVDGVLAAIDEDPRARALLAMALSGDGALVGGLAEKHDALQGWVDALTQPLAALGLDGPDERAELVVDALVGRATRAALGGAIDPDRRRRLGARVVDGALAVRR